MPAAVKNYYDILGVEQKASPEDIRNAYLKLAHRYHPDKTGGDKAAEEKLKEINEAYDTLKNPEKRKLYDQELEGPRQFHFERGFEGAGAGGGFTAEDFTGAGFSGFGGFEDLFGSIFGGRDSRSRYASPQQGGDVEVALTVSLRDAALGASKKIRVARRETCPACGGNGAAPGTQPQPCPTCRGTGTVQRSRGAAFSIGQPCPRCGGTGTIVPNPCPRCAGTGSVQTDRELTVTIPAGVDTGARLRLAGEGEPGQRGGPRGDLYVQINVAADEFFTREGENIKCVVPVPFSTAVLGGSVRVPTLTGSAELKIRPGTANGSVLRMRGLGAARLHNRGRGDQLVEVKIEAPTHLSEADRKAVEQLSHQSKPGYYPQYQQFVRKVQTRRS